MAEQESSANHNVKAQLFDAYGHRIGGEIAVAPGRENQYHPVVAMDARGNFVVAWTLEYSLTDTDVMAARFSANGAELGAGEFAVANSWKKEYDPSVAMAADGHFVVTYTYQFASDDTDVYAAMFRPDGTLTRHLFVAYSSQFEGQSSVAAAPDGRFDVAYIKSGDVYLQRYTCLLYTSPSPRD